MLHQLDIFESKYDYASGSKANRMRAFWNIESNFVVGKLIKNMLIYWKNKKEINNQVITSNDQKLYDKCMEIADRLLSNSPFQLSKKEDETIVCLREQKLNELLIEFDNVANYGDHTKRGYLLEDLLNRLFKIFNVSTKQSFTRNSRGEQIDGAFFLNGWYYLVECKWIQKLISISELDNLLGKVNRSGKQAMGLMLSMEGWSANVPALLKQNPEKCIILMDGYDIRCVLSGAINLLDLLEKKLEKLNLESEPFYSAKDMLT